MSANLSTQGGGGGGQAIPFITVDDKSGTFEVTQQAMVFLEGLPRTSKISVVAIAGPYRTGKSFLANRIIGQQKGFEIGSTTQACTKGLWIWNRAIELQDGNIMLLVDTEGLSSTERSTNIDIKIFTLSILLSSLFLYNQMGPINELSLEDLSLVANLTQYIHIQQSNQKDTGQDFKHHFPSFFWVLRDFYHSLEGLTPRQYLEDCLQPTGQLSADGLRKNAIREAITKYFRERECFTLIRPVAEESKLAHLDDLPFESLKNDFRRECSSLVGAIKRKLRPKVVNGKALNSSMFLQLALEYTEAINAKETPTVLTAIERVIQAETMKIMDQQYEAFCQELNEVVNEDTVPLGIKPLTKTLKKLKKKHLLSLQHSLAPILGFSEILFETQRFQERIADLCQQKQQLNYSASYHYSMGLIKKMLSTVETLNEHQPITEDLSGQVMHDYPRKWHQLLKDYRNSEAASTSALQYEVFCELVVKVPPTEAQWVDKTLVEFERDDEAEAPDMGDEPDVLDDTPKLQQQHYDLQTHHLLSILERVIDHQLLDEVLNTQLNRLREDLEEGKNTERRLELGRRETEQQVGLQRVQNEELGSLKHDLELRIDNLKRDLASRSEEISNMQQVKESEAKNVRKNYERQLREREEEVKLLEGQKTQTQQVHAQTQKKAAELESEKRKEVGQIQNEIKKLEEDVEELKAKMKNKENNPYFMQVNTFFSEVKEYIQHYKEIFLANEESDQKQRKLRLFTLQKQLNDLDYQATQQELSLKKSLDEDLRLRQAQLDSDLESQAHALDQERLRIGQLTEKKGVYEQQLEGVIGGIQGAKERAMSLGELKEKQERQCAIKTKKIEEMHNEIKEAQALQMRMEEKIYMLSIQNKQRQEDKEVLLMLLPQIYKALSGKGNNIKGFLQQIENDMLKNKVIKLFQGYKIPYK